MSTNHSSPIRARLGRRLAVLGSVLTIAMIGTAAPASASLQAIAIAAQTGTVTAGTAGSATYVVTVTRSASSPGSPAVSASGLPAGATASFGTPSAWSPASGTGSRTYPLTVNVSAAVPAGTYSFNVQASASFNTTRVTTGTLTVNALAQPQTITFDPLADKAFGAPDFDVSATATSGLPVSFAATGDCTLTGTSVHLTAVGTCSITASQAGNASWTAAPDVVQAFNITPGDQTISFDPLPARATVESDFTVAAAASSGLPVTFVATSGPCSMTGVTVHLTSVAGSCTITASQLGDGNWNAAADVVQAFDVIAPTDEIWAVTGSTTLAGLAVNVRGYNLSGAAVTKPGGPKLTATVGQPVVLALHNDLAEATSLTIRGQNLPTDQVGAAPGGVRLYTFTPTEPGTFIYEAGPLVNTQHQVAMGLYGTLVVNPDSGPAANDALIVISEIDPALSNSATPATFDMRNYAPKYTLINGAVYSSTASASLGEVAAGEDILLRYVNAGINYHSMSVLGADQQIVADDGHALANPYMVVAQTVGPGQTTDAIVHASDSAAAGTVLTVFDANLQLRNRNRRPATSTATVSYGGALGFVQIGGTPDPTDVVGPLASNLSATTTSISATISDVTTGGGDIDAAEYSIDGEAAVAFAGTFGTPTESVNDTFAMLVPGSHTIRVRGHDSAGNWGLWASVVVSTDNQSPTVTGLTLTPNPSNGTGGVALHATASDVGSGGSNIVSAEYSVDGGSAVVIVPNNVAATASLDATIPSGLGEGDHSVTVSATDAGGNVGSATITLTVDQTGPPTSSVTVAPSPNNGTIGINSSTPAVRVTASATDTTSKVVQAEGFIDTVGANGGGFPFVPTDGAWTSLTESIRVDIPLTTIAALSGGNHTIYVHAKDAAGNWGATSTTVLVIDKTPPTVSSIDRIDATPTSAASVQFLVTFSESVAGATTANFATVGTAPGASVTSVTGTGTTRTVTVNTGTGGGTLGLDLTSATGIKDVAGNEMSSTGLPFVGQVYMVVSPPLYFSTAGGSNPPGVTGTADDADIYWWNGSAFSRSIDVSGITNPLPGGANVDGFGRVDATHFYMSFSGNVTIPIPGPDLSVADEDVVYYDAGAWSLFFDGSANGVAGTDLDAISIVGGTLYFSTDDNDNLPGVAGPGGDDADIYRWNGGSSYARMFDASALGWSTTNVDGLVWVDSTHLYLSYSADTSVPVLAAVQDEDVVYYNAGTWSVYFDGTSKGLTSGNLDVDAFDIP